MENMLKAVNANVYGANGRLKARNGHDYTVATYLAVDESLLVEPRSESGRA